MAVTLAQWALAAREAAPAATPGLLAQPEMPARQRFPAVMVVTVGMGMTRPRI